MLDWGVYNIPFSSERKKMSWIVQQGSTSDQLAPKHVGQYRLYCKGAPRQVLDACSFIVTSISEQGFDQKEALSNEKKQSIMDLVSSWQDTGLRALAISYRDIKEKPKTGWDSSTGAAFESDMSLLAVVGIEDPLRASVPQAIAECHKAGIDVRMCTGDALSTAIAIAKGCCILRETDIDTRTGLPKNGFAMTGAEFDDRVHRKDSKKAKIVRRVFDPKFNDAVDSLAEPFLLDDAGNKVLDQKAFDDLWPTLRVLARCQPEDKVRFDVLFLRQHRCCSRLNLTLSALLLFPFDSSPWSVECERVKYFSTRLDVPNYTVNMEFEFSLTIKVCVHMPVV
jgi:P-type Ca2+ transporter type 2B